MNELYKNNEDFRNYVDKYCTKHKCSAQEALSHKLIRGVAEFYGKKSESGKRSRSR